MSDLVEEWRKARDAALVECQASMFDGECVHRNCPMDGGVRDLTGCPLPWHRNRDGDDE